MGSIPTKANSQKHNHPTIAALSRNTKKKRRETNESGGNTKKPIIMIKETQQLIIILLGAIAIICILKDYDMMIISTIIGILGGFLTGKTLTEKQQEIIEEQTITDGDGDVR